MSLFRGKRLSLEFTMTKKTKLSILGLIILILLVLIIILLRMKNNAPTTTSSQTISTTTPTPANGLTPLAAPTVIEPAPTEPQPQKPEVIAALFAERYGSYSNQSEYQNLRDLFSQMTARERIELEAYIAAHPFEAGNYTGTTTKVVRTEKGAETENHVSLTVFTQPI